jgi:hypothetical protein
MSRITQLRPLLKIARDLTEPTESNREYIRGQAELICDYAGLHMDQKELVMLCISHGKGVSKTISELIETERNYRS